MLILWNKWHNVQNKSRYKLKINNLCSKNHIYINLNHISNCSFLLIENTLSITKTNQLMLCRETIHISSEIRMKHLNTLCGQNVEFL